MTYVRIKIGWCYLAVLLDLFARHVVGFSVSDSPDSVLTTKALQMAYQTRLKPSGVLFHSDQGTHYTSKAYAESVSSCEGMTQSMSQKVIVGTMHPLSASLEALRQNGCLRVATRIQLKRQVLLAIISGVTTKR